MPLDSASGSIAHVLLSGSACFMAPYTRYTRYVLLLFIYHVETSMIYITYSEMHEF